MIHTHIYIYMEFTITTAIFDSTWRTLQGPIEARAVSLWCRIGSWWHSCDVMSETHLSGCEAMASTGNITTKRFSFFSVAPQFCWYAKQQNINAFSVFNSTVTLRRHIWMSFSCVSYLSRNLWFTLLSSLHFQTTPWISSRFDNFSNIYLEVIHSDSLCHLYNR